MEIKFLNLKIEDGFFSCDVDDGLRQDNIYFSSSIRCFFCSDDIAYALSTLCGDKYDSIKFDFCISEKCKDNISRFTKADIWINDGKKITYSNKVCIEKKPFILNFSGGLDSLAALSLLPRNDTALVSLDFGGWFERETCFFELFNPCIVKTDFRQKKFDRNSWTYMGAGALLLHSFFDAKYNVFGTVMEASPDYLKNDVVFDDASPFKDVGLHENRMINGLTEVGTAILSCYYYTSNVIEQSLKSLAASGSNKYVRKELLIDFANHYIHGSDLSVLDYSLIDEHWGNDFASDFNYIYMLAKMKPNYSFKHIPSDVVALCERISGDFYEKFNTIFLEYIPVEYRGYIVKKMIDAGINLYTKKDFDEIELVKNELGKCYPNVIR